MRSKRWRFAVCKSTVHPGSRLSHPQLVFFTYTDLICHLVENLPVTKLTIQIFSDFKSGRKHRQPKSHFLRLLLPRMFWLFLWCAQKLPPPHSQQQQNNRSWWSCSCPTKLSDSRKGSALEIHLLLLHTSGLNNSAMRAASRSRPLPASLAL